MKISNISGQSLMMFLNNKEMMAAENYKFNLMGKYQLTVVIKFSIFFHDLQIFA